MFPQPGWLYGPWSSLGGPGTSGRADDPLHETHLQRHLLHQPADQDRDGRRAFAGGGRFLWGVTFPVLGWATIRLFSYLSLCVRVCISLYVCIFESLRDEYRPHPDYIQGVQVRDDSSKLRSMVVRDARWRTQGYLAQPKLTVVELGRPWP